MVYWKRKVICWVKKRLFEMGWVFFFYFFFEYGEIGGGEERDRESCCVWEKGKREKGKREKESSFRERRLGLWERIREVYRD